MNKENEILIRKLEREREARQQAESLLEEKSLMLYESNKKLIRLNKLLENVIELRTKKLSEREHEYFAIVESIADIICKVNLKGEITFANQIASEIFKGKRMELLGRSVWDFVPEENKRRAFYFFAKQFVQRNRNAYLEIPIEPIEGERLWVRVNIQFTEERCMGCELRSCLDMDNHNQKDALFTCDFKEIIVVAHNITDKKKSEQEVERSLKRQEVLSEILTKYNSLQQFETTTKESIQIIGEYLGVSRITIFEDLKQNHFLQKIYEWKGENVLQQVDKINYQNITSLDSVLHSDEVIYAATKDELPNDLKENLQISEEYSSILLPLQISEEKKGILVFDICDRIHQWTAAELKFLRTVVNLMSTAFLRHAMQLHLEQTKKKAEEATLLKSKFLTNVSHEIRTSLNVVLGLSEWLHTHVENDDHKKYLHTILTNGRTLLNQVNDLLDLPKVEEGNIQVEFEPMQLGVVFNQLEQELLPRLKEKGLNLSFDIHSSVPNQILMDEVRFYQIFFNLLTNSIKNTDRGSIRLEVKALHTTKPTVIHLLISLKDTRTNILEHEFDRSGELQSYHLFGKNSEGIFSLVEGLLKKLNGELSIQVEHGKGVEIAIKLSDINTSSTVFPDLKEESLNNFTLQPCKILIVDDFPFNIMVLKRIIDFDNITFYEAESGEVALEILELEKPDLIFMDIRMPGMNGYETLDKIREDETLKNIPVVAFTASGMADDIQQLKDYFDYYLHKPVAKKDVYHVLKMFLPVNYID